ncbi:MAG: malto-oligosyltrehalose trehalohydrolase [Candidatus Omnitrophica bacterium]|nr:malto-oligosyltrehalose trehalohydrolase [Candidatus Omnitrophota bacterium]MDD5553231.1 malto-oligosyltrehalose trehalohydrolase [Candidatus Omnitrophota bacterium]
MSRDPKAPAAKTMGADYRGNGECDFVLWAPQASQVYLRILSRPGVLPMVKDSDGYWSALAHNILPGEKYFYRLRDLDRPDPVSFYQPEGVTGPSCVVDHLSFSWQDNGWRGVSPEDMILYELHTGTFSQQGDFEGVIARLDYLKELGVNALELMPVAQFPGKRNWGYDGVFPFAVQDSYGGPQGLKELVNAAHLKGIAVLLDVVYNHFGPEGNFAAEFMPCFTDKYKTPWGKAVNFDDAYSWGVRRFFISNALYWFEHFHMDGLRLDAVHGIYDSSAKHFLRELSEEIAGFSAKRRRVYLFAENDLNDARTVLPHEEGGMGLDGVWNDDFHHSLHTALTGEKKGYYEDFGSLSGMVKAIKEGYVYSWDYSDFRKKFHGSSSKSIPASRFVVFAQNHDQVGNRLRGERLSRLVPFGCLKLAAAAVMLSPFIPLIFMGEEYGEESPFCYFMSFYDRDLVGSVRRGRKKEFESFGWKEEPCDPYAEETFYLAKLKWEKNAGVKNKSLLGFYKELIGMRRRIPALKRLDKESLDVQADEGRKILVLRRYYEDSGICALMNFSAQTQGLSLEFSGKWRKIIDSSDEKWQGGGSTLPDEVFSPAELLIDPFTAAVWEK